MTIDVETGVTSESCLCKGGGGMLMVREAIETGIDAEGLKRVPYERVHKARRVYLWRPLSRE